MQVTTLNRVISLFIIGVMVMVVAAFAEWSAIEGWLRSHPLTEGWGPIVGVAAALAFGAAAVVLGLAVDAVGDTLVRNLILERLLRRDFPTWAPRPFRGMSFWRLRMRGLLQDRGVPPDEEFSFAAAHFFRTADAKHTEWLVQHYAMYQLECDAALVGSAAAVVLAFEQRLAAAAVSLICLLMLYHSWERVAYVYQVVFRNTCLAVEEATADAGAGVERRPGGSAAPSAAPSAG